MDCSRGSPAGSEVDAVTAIYVPRSSCHALCTRHRFQLGTPANSTPVPLLHAMLVTCPSCCKKLHGVRPLRTSHSPGRLGRPRQMKRDCYGQTVSGEATVRAELDTPTVSISRVIARSPTNRGGGGEGVVVYECYKCWSARLQDWEILAAECG